MRATIILNFRNSGKFPPRIKKYPLIPAGNFWDAGFPGIAWNSRFLGNGKLKLNCVSWFFYLSYRASLIRELINKYSGVNKMSTRMLHGRLKFFLYRNIYLPNLNKSFCQWLDIPTKFLQPANLTTYTILSLFSLRVELAPRLSGNQTFRTIDYSYHRRFVP